MALYQVNLRMAHDVTWVNRRKWSNTFYVDVANAAAAAAYLVGLWGIILRSAADSTVFAYEVYARDLNPASDDYAVQSIPVGNQRGTRVNPSNDKYLTKACVAVTLNAIAGRPSRKFWRFGLHENDTSNGVSVSEPVATLIVGAFEEILNEFSTPFLDPDGQQLTGVGRLTLTTREFGRTAGADVPQPPPVG